MPELPEVETVRRLLAPAMQGARFRRVIVNRPDLRIPFPERFADRLRGITVSLVMRRGKYLVVSLSSGQILVADVLDAQLVLDDEQDRHVGAGSQAPRTPSGSMFGAPAGCG